MQAVGLVTSYTHTMLRHDKDRTDGAISLVGKADDGSIIKPHAFFVFWHSLFFGEKSTYLANFPEDSI